MTRTFLSSQTFNLRFRPLVVGTLMGGGSLPLQIKNACSPYVDIVEIRLDSFRPVYDEVEKAHVFSKNFIGKVQAQTKKPILITFRTAQERNVPRPKYDTGNSLEREVLLKRLLPFCQLIDLEIRQWPFAKRMTRWAHLAGVDVIHSYHRFGSSFDYETANELAKKSLLLKGDIFKVAMSPKKERELQTFLYWGMELKNPLRVLIGMGKAGKISRFLGYAFGSVLTYGHLGFLGAPGQMPARELGENIRNLYRK